MSKKQLSNESDVLEVTKLATPPEFNVVFYNDDYTTMDFVVSVLVGIFHFDVKKAEATMLAIHTHGKAVVGTYNYEIVVTRQKLTLDYAREHDFPLKVEVERVS